MTQFQSYLKEASYADWTFLGSVKPTSRISVELSRPLTWAEWEDLRNEFYSDSGVHLEFDEKQGFSRIHLTADAPSRLLFDDFAECISTEFVNVYPKAVRTYEENK